MARYAHIVVVGRFRGYGTAYWNTLDASRPDGAVIRRGGASIRTPVLIDFTDDIRGEPTTALQAAIPDHGEVGCDKMVTDYRVDLVEGQRYVFFLHPTTGAEGAPSADLAVMDAWPFESGDLVESRYEGPISLADLKRAIVSGGTEQPHPSEGDEPPQDTYP
jgi:hypothetical protein